MIMFIRAIKFGLMVLTLVVSTHCQKKSDSSSSDSDSPASEEENPDGIDNPLAAVYPGGLNLALFPESNEGASLAATEEAMGAAEKDAEAKEILNGKGDSCLPPIFARAAREDVVTCYEFDQEMVYGTNPSGQTYGTFDGTDGNGEACLPAFARAQVAEVEHILDKSLGLTQALLCQAKKDATDEGVKLALPENSKADPLDLADALVNALGNKVSEVETATITRLDDQNDQPVFRTDIVATMADA